MAHAVETMAYAGEVPWHGLGVKVIDDLTPEQMMEKAGIDWTVKKRPMTYSSKHKVYEVPGKQALIRESDGKLLDVVGSDWEPVQNAQAMGFFHDFVMEGNMKMHTAGSLREGQMVWALAKVDNDFEVFGGDKVESYMLFSNPHQYGKSVDVRFTPIRVVCNNTLSLALGAKDMSVQVGHRKEFDAQFVKQALGLAEQRMDEYRRSAEFLGSKKYNEDTLKQYFGEILGTSKVSEDNLSRTAKRAFEIVDTQPGAEYRQGTWWNALNAVTFLTDHELGRNADNRVSSAWFGGNRVRKIKAMTKALDYANAA